MLRVTARVTSVGRVGAEWAIQRPALELAGVAIPVELGLWTVTSTTGSARPSIGANAGVTRADQAALRFERLLGVAEAGTAAALELTPPDGDLWLRSWAERLVAARDEAKELSGAPVDGLAKSQILLPEDDQLTRNSARLDEWLEQVGDAFPGGEANDPSERDTEAEPLLGVSAGGTPMFRAHLVTAGDLDRLTLDAMPGGMTQRQMQLAGVSAVICLCAVGLLLLRWPEVRDFIYGWPHAVAFIAGLAYWAWLRPSWLGLVIAGVSVLLAWRSGWPGRAIRMDGSTVLRANRP